MRIFSYLFEASRTLMVLALVTSMLGGLSSAGLLSVIGQSISGGVSRATLAWQFFGLCVAYVIFKSASEITLLRLTQTATMRLRIMLSRKLLSTPLATLDALGQPRLLVILTRDIDAFIQAYQYVPMACGNAVVVIACFAYLAWLSWKVFLAFTGLLIVGTTLYHFAERVPRVQLMQSRNQIDRIYENFRGLIGGSKELQLNARRAEVFVDHVITPDLQKYSTIYTRTMSTYIWIVNIGGVLFFFAIGLQLFIMPQLWKQDLDVLITITLVLLYLIQPIIEMMNALPLLRHAGIALRKIEQLDTSLTAIKAQPATNPFAVGSPLQLELCGVGYHHKGPFEDHGFALGPLDLTVGLGEILFIVGGNGSGKTTLALVLLGLYENETGTIILNGVPVTDANRHAYRQHFSAVFSDFHVFEELLGDDRPSLSSEAKRYINRLEMSEKVRIVDGRFSTLNLSSGQRKRLALIASYLEDRPVYLFDEWAADQDPVFKRVFYSELLPELKKRGKTVLVITHDDAYFSYADRLVKLENGRLHPVDMTVHTAPISVRA